MNCDAVGRHRRPTLASVVLLLATLIIFGAFVAGAWSPILASFGGDNAVYWLTANYYSPFGEPLIPAALFAQTSRYPPLYPILLAMTGGGSSVLAAHLITVSFFLGALVVIYCIYRDAGLSRFEAYFLVVLFCMLRITRLESLQLHSEQLYLLLTATAIWAVRRTASIRDQLTSVILIAGVSGALLTRTAGITLVAAFALYALGNRQRGLLPHLAVVALPALYTTFAHNGRSSYLSQFVLEYTKTDFPERLLESMGVLGYEWVWTFIVPFHVTYSIVFFALLAVLFLAGVAYRVVQGKLDGYYVALYLLMVIVWPYPEEAGRLLYPVLPFLLLYGYTVPRDLLGRVTQAASAKLLAWLCPVLLLVFVLPDVMVFIGRFTLPVPAAYQVYKHTLAWHEPDQRTVNETVGYLMAADQAYAEIRRITTPHDCILAIKPSIAGMNTNRFAFAPPAIGVGEEEFAERIAARGCRFVLLVRRPSPSFPAAFYPVERLTGEVRPIKTFRNPLDPSRIEVQLVELVWSDATPDAFAAPTQQGETSFYGRIPGWP